MQRAIEAGDIETGISLMAMEPGLDTGPVLSKHGMPIRDDHTGGRLLDELAALGASALLENLSHIESLLAAAIPQQHDLATYAHKIDKAERHRLGESADTIWRRIRAFHPTLLATPFWVRTGSKSSQHTLKRIRLPVKQVKFYRRMSAACGCAVRLVLVITEAQLPGAKAQPVTTLINGYRERLRPGVRLSPGPIL